MPYKKINNYLDIPFCSECNRDDFYIYLDIQDLLLKCKIFKDRIIKCRTLGILKSCDDKVPHKVCLDLYCACHPEILDCLSLCPVIALGSLPVKPEHSSAYTLLLGGRIFGKSVVPPQSDSARVLPLIELPMNNADEIKIRVSMKYLKTPPKPTFIPYTVQIFGTLQWKQKPVLFANLLQVIGTTMAIRLKETLSSVTSIHLALPIPFEEDDIEVLQ